MKIYLTGISGMLGTSLYKTLKKNYEISGCDKIKNKYSMIDISDYNKLRIDIEKFKPDIIIHTAAIIDIEYCEYNKHECYQSNVKGTENIVKICKENNIKLIYISTPSIFRGESKIPYTENDIPNPVNYYGYTKLEGERLTKELSDYLILRINIFGNKGFNRWIISNLYRKEIEVYNNFYNNMIYVDDLSKVIDQLIQKNINGIYNIATKKIISKYDYTCLFAKVFGYSEKNIKPIKIEDQNLVNRGHYLGLNITKIQNIGIDIISLEESLNNFRSDYL